jgi:wyosine [tRNA(Phe)-imidazoG37] synthetase (radical SAM superfamily)
MKHIYGPVNSRRLGLSLGITLTPQKICNFDCVYCQLGKTTLQTNEIKEYINTQEILDELKSWITNNPPVAQSVTCITFSGSGEPTLHNKIGLLINEIKRLTGLKIAVITNGALLSSPEVRQSLLGADLVVPSLDAVNIQAFNKVNRPAGGISPENIVNGLIAFRKQFRGEIWLEVMLLRGINDDLRHIKKLKLAIDEINPDKIQLNSPVRSTSEPGLLSVDKAKLKKIQKLLGEKCEII